MIAGQIRVRNVDVEHEDARRLLRWLSHRPEVTGTARRRRTGSLVVRYAEPEQHAGRFARALRDELFVLALPAQAPPLQMRLDHVLRGRARLRVQGASPTDLRRLAAWIGAQPGVTRVTTSEATQSILFHFDDEITSPTAIAGAARQSRPADWPREPPRAPARFEIERTALNTAVLGLTLTGLAPPPLSALAIASTAVPPARRALAAAREKRLSVDVLDVAAITISLATGQHVTASVLTWLLGIGDLMLERAAGRARDVMSKLADIDVIDAWILHGDRVERARADRLRRGDRFRVHAGERVPADGVVVRGTASVDEKALTGESMPRTRRAGARVLAASVLRAGQLDVEVTRAGADTAAAGMLHILQGAGDKPMTLQRETERIADRVVAPSIALAVSAGALSSELARTTSVLITDFGSGIRIAPPTAALAAMAAAARQGVLIKGGQYLERLSKVDVIVFDKTGTLTAGSPRIVDVHATGALGSRATLRLAAAAEARQSHPMAGAIRALADKERLFEAAGPAGRPDLRSFEYTTGAGVDARVADHRVLVGSRRLMNLHHVDVSSGARAADALRQRGASIVYAAVDGTLELVMGYADVVRDEAPAVLDLLRANGRREVVLMSGDAVETVNAIGEALGIGRSAARMLPEDKAREVREMQRAGHVIAMVGDGINDAPALAVADVGISLHGGTAAALETADVILVDGGLSMLPRAFALADRGMTAVKWSLGLVLAPNAVAIALGALGLLAPGAAAVVNNGSTIAAAAAAMVVPRLRLRVIDPESRR